MHELVRLHDGEPTTDTLIVAEGANVTHKAVIQLVRKYQEDFEKVGGQLTFEMGVRSAHGAGQKTEYAILNESQAILLFTFMKNTEIVRSFKVRLVQDFVKLRQMVMDGYSSHRDSFGVEIPENMMLVTKDEVIAWQQSEIDYLRLVIKQPRKHRPHRPFTDDDRVMIIKLSKQGFSQRQIAEKIDRSTAQVSMTSSNCGEVD